MYLSLKRTKARLMGQGCVLERQTLCPVSRKNKNSHSVNMLIMFIMLMMAVKDSCGIREFLVCSSLSGSECYSGNTVYPKQIGLLTRRSPVKYCWGGYFRLMNYFLNYLKREKRRLYLRGANLFRAQCGS